MKTSFPIFKNNQGLVYLDSAATTQLPQSVVLAMHNYLTSSNANIHRGQYDLSLKATDLYEETRKEIGEFINAKNKSIIITSGTTSAIAQVIFGLKPQISKGDLILVAQDNHHSNFVGWQRLCQEKKATLGIIPIDNDGRLNMSEYKRLLQQKPKVVALSHVSNVTGVIHPVAKLCQLATKQQAITVIDGAQAVAHTKVDIQKIGCDFYVFSGHKVFGPTGIGVLIGNPKILNKMEPLVTGGGMIGEVTNTKSTWAKLPAKFEAGTPNILGAIGLGAAIRWWKKQNQKAIHNKEKQLTGYLIDELGKIDNLFIVGPAETTNRVGVVSFYHKSIHAHDIAEILAANKIAVRAGHHCTMPLHKSLGIIATVRISFGPYNNKEDITSLITTLKQGIAKLT